MHISWNWLSEWVDLKGLKDPQALADLLTGRGLEVESVEQLNRGFEHVVTAQILDFKPHPQADRLNLCRVTTGQGEPLEIVCGARNVAAGAKVALAQVGANLPNGVKITASQIRGVTSKGMLCSEEELKLSESSEGILILPESTPLGVPLADILERNDAIFTLKVTSNRSDCLSHLGIAREVASALRTPLKKHLHSDLPTGKSPIQVRLEAGEMAPQFFGCAIEGARVGPSPSWMVKRLEALGCRSINNVVDASNLVMFEMGHPTHVYDSDKIRGQEIIVRKAQQGEELPLLDGTTVQLEGFELVIADQERAIGLAGVMGGGNSEVEKGSRNLFIECAEFNPVLVRRAASRHQKKTDAAHRFERGVDPEGLSQVTTRLVNLILEVAGGKAVGSIANRISSASGAKGKREIRFGIHFLSDFLGFERDQEPLTLKKTEEILRDLNCEVRQQESEWMVYPPSYRLDLNLKEDIAEEIARSIGYDCIPATIPALSSLPGSPRSSLPAIQVMNRAKESLVRSGLLETIGFSFSNQIWLERFDLKSTVSILNPLSENYAALVPSLLPGLVQNALDNWSHHFGSEPLSIRLFELRPTFSAQSKIEARSQTETGVAERWKLAFLISGPRFAGGLRCEKGEVDFYDLKSIIDNLLTVLGTRGLRYVPLSSSRTGGNSMFHPGQAAELLVGNSVGGHFGLIHPGKMKGLKARAPIWMAELDWENLTKLSRKASEVAAFRGWSQFPAIERDFALVVKSDVTAEKLCQIALQAGKPLAKEAKVFDVYRGTQVAEGMTSVAVRVIFYDEQRSLQESEAEAASVRILESWKKELSAELRD